MDLRGFGKPRFNNRAEVTRKLQIRGAKDEERRKSTRSIERRITDVAAPLGNIKLGRKQGESNLDVLDRQAQSFNERFYGGLTRGAIRTGSALLPKDNKEVVQDIASFGVTRGIRFVTNILGTNKDKRAEDIIKQAAPEAGTPEGKKDPLWNEADPNSFGGKAGTVAKGAVDVGASFVAGGVGANAAAKVPTLAKGVTSDQLLKRAGAKAGIEFVSGLFASGASAIQQKGSGDNVDTKQTFGTGAAIDIGIGLLSGVTKPFVQKLADTANVAKVTSLLNKRGINASDDAAKAIAKTRNKADIERILIADSAEKLRGTADQAKRIDEIGASVAPQRTKRIIAGELYELNLGKKELDKLSKKTRLGIVGANREVKMLQNKLERLKTNVVRQDLKRIAQRGEKAAQNVAENANYQYGRSLFFGDEVTDLPTLTTKQELSDFDAGVASSLLENLDSKTVNELYDSLTELKNTPYWDGLRGRLSGQSKKLDTLFKQFDDVSTGLGVLNLKRKGLIQEINNQGVDAYKFTPQQEQALAQLEDEARIATGAEAVSDARPLGDAEVPIDQRTFDGFGDAPTVKKELGPIQRQTRKAQEAIRKRVDGLLASDSRVAPGLARTATSIASDLGRPEAVQQSLRTLNRVAGAAAEQGIQIMTRVDNTLKALDEPMRDSVTSLLRSGKTATPDELAKLSEEAQGAYYGIRNAVDALHTSAYLMGDISEATFKKGKGNYLTRVHKIYDIENNLPPEVKKFMKNSGFKVDDTLAKSRDLTDEQFAKVSAENPALSIGKQMRFVEYNRATKQFLSELVQQGNTVIRDTPAKNFIKVSDNHFYGPAAGKYIRKDIMDDIAGFSTDIKVVDVMMDALDLYEGLGIRQFRKKMLAVYNPAVRMINKHFNSALAFQGGIDSNAIRFERDMNRAFTELTNNSGRARAWEKKGLFASDSSRAEFKRQAKKLEESKGTNPLKWLDDQAISRYTKWDDAAKMAAAERLVKKGFTPEQAVTEASRVFQDYSTVGLLWDISAKVPVLGKPFGRFTGDYLFRVLPNLVINKPLRAVGTIAALAGIQQGLSKLSGETPEDRKTRENRVGAGKIPILNISTEFQTPYGAVDIRRFMGVQGVVGPEGMSGVGDVLPFFNPVAKNPDTGATEISGEAAGSDVLIGPVLQQLINRDFRQKPIDDPEAAKFGDDFPLSVSEKIKNRIKAFTVSFTPPPVIDAINLQRSTQFEKNEEGLMERKKTVYGSKRNPTQAMLRFFGVRYETYGKEEAEKSRNMKTYFDFKRAKDEMLSKLDPDTKRAYEANHPPATDRKGNFIHRDDPFYTPEKMLSQLNNPELFNTERKLALLEREMLGKPVNPIYLVPDQHANAVMIARASILEQGGDDKAAILYAQPWYKGFQQAEKNFYDAKDAYNKKTFGDSAKKFPERFEDNAPIPTPKIERMLTQYNKLPENDGPKGGNLSRRVYLEDNPSLAVYFDRRRQWKNVVRQRMSSRLGIKLPLDPGFNGTSLLGDFRSK